MTASSARVRAWIDLFDPSSAYRGTLPAGTLYPIVFPPGGRLGIVEKDEFDVARLVVVMQLER